MKELVLISFLTLLVRVPWMIMIPTVEAPDETTHVWVIQFCAEHLSLPALADIKQAGPVAVYGSIPQFGYLPHIALLRLLPGLNQLVTERLGSLLMALISVIVAYFVGRRVFLPDRLLALALPLLLIFHPQFVLVGAYANNDITACALSGLILILLIKTLDNGLRPAVSVVLGILLSWVVLSKYSALPLVPSSLFILGVAAWLHKTSLKTLLLNLFGMIAPVVFLTGMWFFRNYHEFEQDTTGTRTLHYIWTTTYHRKFDSYRPPWEIVIQSRWWRMNFFSFWGWFGYMTRSLPRPFYYGYLTFVVLAFCGGLKSLMGDLAFWRRPFSCTSDETAPAAERAQPFIWLLFLLLSLANLLTSLAASSTGIAGPQGRYLFISLVPLMALLLGGLARLPGKWARFVVWALLAFNLATYIYSSVFLYSLYRGN